MSLPPDQRAWPYMSNRRAVTTPAGMGRTRSSLTADQIGPDYQPGHAHCDTLSYELAINGRRVVVDSGVFDYEAELRAGLCAKHQSPQHSWWLMGRNNQKCGVFRVARRARPLQGLSSNSRSMDQLCSRVPTMGTQDWQVNLFISGACPMMGRKVG